MPSATQTSSAPSSPGGKKFSTIAGNFGPFGGSGGGTAKGSLASNTATAGSNRPSSKNIFGDAAPTVNKLGLDDGALLGRPVDGGRTPAAAASLAPGGRSRNSTVAHQEGPWSVSVAEVKEEEDTQQQQRSSRKATKKKAAKGSTSAPAYTLYITTPTHNLTLQRSASDIVEMDMRLREGNSTATASFPRLPTLSSSPSASSGGSKILKTLSRTLSPGGNRNRTGLSQLTGFGDSQTPKSTSKSSSPLKPGSRDGTVSPAAIETGTDEEKTTHALASYFTTVSNLPAVRKHKAWKRFVRVRTDDLESQRVERRVHRVRSDLASHIKHVVAPTNTNVGVGPSQSDIGEDIGKTDDEREAASLSGRSGSRHSWGHSSSQLMRPGSSRSSTDRPDVPTRSTSVEGASGNGAAGPNGATGNRSSPNFANIPEEVERERESSMTSLHPERGPSAGTTGAATTTTATTAATTNEAPDTSVDSSAIVKRKKRRQHREPEKVTVDDFEMIRVLGKGCAGKVLLVRHRPTSGLFAMKSIHKRHVLAHQELQHTLTEQAVLKRMARDVQDPFVVKLWWSFHDRTNLYLVMDFHPGGDLATQLSRWGRLGRDRARFYAAEIVEGVEGLHKAGVIYRDLKPENVLIGADGHIVLSDFGLSKEFPARDTTEGHKSGIDSTPPSSPARSASNCDLSRSMAAGRSPHWMSASSDDTATMSAGEGGAINSPANRSRSRWTADERDTTTTFCGTAEYLAPEVIQGSAYSYEVDWWSFGTMLYEMLTGITPFWADTHADMYVRVLHDELVFPDDRVLDMDTKSILRGLLQRNPMLRMKEPRIKKHPYFSMIEWAHVFHKRYIPPYIPPIDPSNAMDTQNFDEAFLDMQPVVNGDEDEDDDAPAASDAGKGSKASKSASKSITAKSATTTASPAKSKASEPASKAGKSVAADGKSLFDGYSFRGRKDSGSIHSTAYSESLDAATSGGANESTAAADESGVSGAAAAMAPVAVAAATPSEPSAHGPTAAAPVAPSPITPRPSAPPATSSSQASSSSMPSLLNALAPTPAASYLKQQQLRAQQQQQQQQLAQAQAQAAAQAKAAALPSPATPTPPAAPVRTTSKNVVPVSSPPVTGTAIIQQPTDSDSDDDESAARNAVLALAALEREADEEEASMRSGSVGGVGSTSGSSVGGLKTTATPISHPAGTIAEMDGEDAANDADSSSSESVGDAGDEEWDLLDLGASLDGKHGALPSEANGGKGQNLFARGVVDTYRLLRRQDSTRLTPSGSGATLGGTTGSTTAAANGTDSRRFSRLTTRQKQRSAAAAALNGTKSGAGAASATSVVSSDSRSPAGPLAQHQSPAEVTPSSTMLTVPSTSMGKISSPAKNGSNGSRPSSSEERVATDHHSKGGSSSGDGVGVTASKSSSSKIKRRFTTFFEQAGR